MEKLKPFSDRNGILVLSKSGTSQVLSMLGISCMRKDGKAKKLSTILWEVKEKLEHAQIDPQIYDALIDKLKEEVQE